MPEFCMIFAQKIVFPDIFFWGGGVSYAGATICSLDFFKTVAVWLPVIG